VAVYLIQSLTTIQGFGLQQGEVITIDINISLTFEIIILTRNQNLLRVLSIPPTEVYLYNTVVYTIEVESDTNSVINYQLITLYNWVTLDENKLNFFTTSIDSIGIHTITVNISDLLGTVSHTFQIEVKNIQITEDNPAWVTENYKHLIQLIILYPFNKVTNTIEPFYISTYPFITTPTDLKPNITFKSVVLNKVVFTHRISAATDASSDFSYGQISISNTNGEFDKWLVNYTFGYRKVEVFEGYSNNPFNSFNRILEGVVGRYGITLSTTEITLSIYDKRELLNAPAQIEMTSDGKLYPIAFGNCFNVSGLLIDPINQVYKLNFTTIKSVKEVRDAGASFTDFKVSGFNDYTVDLQNATVTLQSPPLGQVTFDIEGTVHNGKYLSTAADIVKYLITEKTQLTLNDIDTDSFNYLNSVCPQTLGFYSNEKITVNDIYSKLFSTIGSFMYLTRNSCIFRCKQFDGKTDKTPKLTINAIKLNTFEVVSQIPPIVSMILGYKQNYTTIDESSQAKAVSYISQRKSKELSEEWYNRVAFTNTRIRDIYLDAVELEETSESENEVIPTYFTNMRDAVKESSRRLVLYGRQRYIFSLVAFEELKSLEICDVINIIHNRFGFNYGKKAIVISIDESTDESVKIEVWI